MLSQTKENYLKALYYIAQKESEISITALGKEMQVSKPTANNMVKKLQQKGWIDYVKYKPLQLTDAGKKEAKKIIRKHRLAEMFLSQIMGFGWEEVHDIAEELEHVKAEKFFERMDELLGFPRVDPHGSPIPDPEGNIHQLDYVPLTQIEVGKRVVLSGLRNSATDFLQYLTDKQLTLGTEIELIEIEKFDESRIISYAQQKRLTLSKAICERLLVKK